MVRFNVNVMYNHPVKSPPEKPGQEFTSYFYQPGDLFRFNDHVTARIKRSQSYG